MNRMLLLPFLMLGGACTHAGSLVSTEKDAWINVNGIKDQLYFCRAEGPDGPACYVPKIYFPFEPAGRYGKPL